MISLKKTITFTILGSLLFSAYSQTATPSAFTIEGSIIDTLKIETNSTLVQVHWLGDTITVSIQKEDVRIDSAYIAKYRKALKDSTMWSTQEEIDKTIQKIKIGAQNCYSYAIERYFDRNETFNQSLFGPTTSMDRESIESLLSGAFEEVGRFSTKPKKNLKQAIPDDVLLGFVNKSDWTIHLIYFNDGIFYSKNGYFKAMEFQSLKAFLKEHYWDTQEIVMYKLHEDKARNALAESAKAQ
jgi:hypothetical protein